MLMSLIQIFNPSHILQLSYHLLHKLSIFLYYIYDVLTFKSYRCKWYSANAYLFYHFFRIFLTFILMIIYMSRKLIIPRYRQLLYYLFLILIFYTISYSKLSIMINIILEIQLLSIRWDRSIFNRTHLI